ncbi:MAG: IPT/TIG domain-containing protein [Patescibacteria group bacterium]
MAMSYTPSFRRCVFLVVSVLIIPSVLFAGHVSTAQGGCARLSRNLSVGMHGEDVRVLQRLLNDDSRTRLVDSGLGSSGAETMYFGEKTRDAVVRFQNIYKKEVLSPVGLTLGSGFVGSYTRAKLRDICDPELRALPTEQSGAIPAISTEVATTKEADTLIAESADATITASLPSNAAPEVNRPSSYVVSPGDKLSVSGAKFTLSDNVLRIGSLAISGLAPNLLGELSTVVPLDAPKGKFDLSVLNMNGESNKSFLIIVTRGTAAPSVKSFSPPLGADGTVVTVVGSGFTSENNEIYFGGAPAKGVAAIDGTTLTFIISMGVPGMSLEQTVAGGMTASTTPVWFYVVNPNGISNKSIFTLTF